MRLIIIGSAGHWQLVQEAARLDGSILVAAVTPGCPEENVDDVRRAFPEARFYGDWREILKREHADMAVVAPWFSRNGEVAAACLSAGLDVYCEKPLATTHEQLAQVAEAWQRSGKALGGMFNYRCSAWFRTMRDAVDQGLLGEIRQIHAQKSYRLGIRPAFFHDRAQMGGLIPWVAIHAIDWACAFGGKCDWVSASHSRVGNQNHGELEVSSAILMGMENGVIATVTADYLRPTGSARHDDDRLRLVGTRGTMEVIDGQVWLENESARRMLEPLEEKSAFLDFVQAIRSGRADEYARAALAATQISLNARDSADENGVRMKND